MKLIKEITDWLLLIGEIAGSIILIGITLAILVGIQVAAVVWIIKTIQG